MISEILACADLVEGVLASVLKEKGSFICENSRKQMSKLASSRLLNTVNVP